MISNRVFKIGDRVKLTDYFRRIYSLPDANTSLSIIGTKSAKIINIRDNWYDKLLKMLTVILPDNTTVEYPSFIFEKIVEDTGLVCKKL